jgi:hypothetical protein
MPGGPSIWFRVQLFHQHRHGIDVMALPPTPPMRRPFILKDITFWARISQQKLRLVSATVRGRWATLRPSFRQAAKTLQQDTAVFAADGQMCAMLVVDIVDFTRPDRDEQIRLHMHKSLYAILREALDASGAPLDRCHVQHRGDGALIILPPEYPVHILLDSFPDLLGSLIRRYNRVSAEEARMQWRAAVHVGPVYRDADGVSGDEVTLLCRILEAPQLSYPLGGPYAVLAFAVSDYVYDTVVRRHLSLADPGSFEPIGGQVKHTNVEAWVLTPGKTMPYLTVIDPLSRRAPGARGRHG